MRALNTEIARHEEELGLLLRRGVRFGAVAKTELKISFFIDSNNCFQGILTSGYAFICNGVSYKVTGDVGKLFDYSKNLGSGTISFDCYGVSRVGNNCNVQISAYNFPLEIQGFHFPDFVEDWKTIPPQYDDSDND